MVRFIDGTLCIFGQGTKFFVPRTIFTISLYVKAIHRNFISVVKVYISLQENLTIWWAVAQSDKQ
jgi:hypothetical protein